MFYLAGDSLLSASMVSQLKELTDAGFQQETSVLAYFDPNCNGKSGRIFDVNSRRKSELKEERKPRQKRGARKAVFRRTIIGDGRDPFVRDIAEDCHIPGLPQIPAAISLRYFLEYARTYYPAKNYMLFLMGHGVIVGNDAFLPDADDNSAITLSDLGWVLKTFGNKVRAEDGEFHLVGFHSCSMSSVELAYELAGAARYMIGTQGAAFPGSWPYRQLLKKIFLVIEQSKTGRERPSANGQDRTVRRILRAAQDLSFHNSEDFWQAGFSADLSLCSLGPDKVDRLTNPLQSLSLAMKKGLELGRKEKGKEEDDEPTNCIRLAHLESQSYWEENYTDLYDFCSCLSARCKKKNGVQAEIRKACNGVIRAMKRGKERFERLVVSSDYYGPAYQFSNGLSIYFPWRPPTTAVMENYQAYRFTQQQESDSWKSFLDDYFLATRRQARKIREPKNGWRGETGSLRWRAEENLLKSLSDQRLLSLGPSPSGAGYLAGGPGKVGGDLAGGPGKVGGDLAGGPGKVGGDLAGGPGKVGGDLAGGPGKVGGDLAGGPGKVGGDLAGGPGKVGGDLAGGPGKVGGDLAGGPGKVGGDMGLFGHTIIKNFENPGENRFVTSRPERFFPVNRKKGSRKRSDKKPGKSTKARR